MIVIETILGVWLALILISGVAGFFMESSQCLICFKRYTLTGILINMALMFLAPFLVVRWVWLKIESWFPGR